MQKKIEMGWALDFMDGPVNGVDLNCWSGAGDLMMMVDGETITYKGANGMISLQPPTEEANTASSMTIVFDASDPSIRQQLRRDIGPRRVRVLLIYKTEQTRTIYQNTIRGVADTGLNSLSTGGMEVSNTGYFATRPVGSVTEGVITGSGGFELLEVGSRVYVKKYSFAGRTMVIFFGNSYWAAQANSSYATAALVDIPSQYSFYTDGDPSLVRIGVDGEEATYTTWAATTKRYVGKLSSPVIKGGIYSVNIESFVSDIDRGRVHYWSDDTQRARHPGDKSFEYMKDYATNGIDTKWPP